MRFVAESRANRSVFLTMFVTGCMVEKLASGIAFLLSLTFVFEYNRRIFLLWWGVKFYQLLTEGHRMMTCED